ncbi:MAG: hypothetical protein DRR08_04310 [Candidatus Parabeggiatoa sp. nov. 2]|nr:MAG: hypothetical protein B6247_09745 [Beggiatoa sp. 4572_84]RKZ63140.1 MAG: hypothetical protein DRR08_04310 [Gammaproteobacteria bacterium]
MQLIINNFGPIKTGEIYPFISRIRCTRNSHYLWAIKPFENFQTKNGPKKTTKTRKSQRQNPSYIQYL